MFDSEYFENHLREQHRRMPGNASTEVHLVDGTVFHVHLMEAALPGYVLLDAYPAIGEDPTQTERRAVAYEAISHVVVTSARVGEMRISGFRAT